MNDSHTPKYRLIRLPKRFAFRHHGVYDFDWPLSFFDWDIKDSTVVIDFSRCERSNYQTLALVMLYVWRLNSQGCFVKFRFSRYFSGATKMWKLMGAKGWSQVVRSNEENFRGHQFKPLLAVRNHKDFKTSLKKVEGYTNGFDVEYEKTLRYVISELLYNTLEHGKATYIFHDSNLRLPSLIQFTWYREKNELHFVIADLGVGIKRHMEQTYPIYANDSEAILAAIRPGVSGTFGVSDPYQNKNNAGAGLFISSNIIRKMKADMHIISGSGLLHISASDITRRTMPHIWPGTFVHVEVKLGTDPHLELHSMMSEFRAEAEREITRGNRMENENVLTLSVYNYFGVYAEDKDAAIKQRNKRILPAIEEGKTIRLDFGKVQSAPHSFLSALLATPIKNLGLNAYKRIKILNANSEIRETIDFIFDDNTK